MVLCSFGKWSALPQRNVGHIEDTSCYLISLQELNGGGERSSLLLTHHLHPHLRKSEEKYQMPHVV